MLRERPGDVLGDRRHDVPRTVGVQLRAQRDRAAAEVAAQARAAAYELVGRQRAARAQVLEERAAQVLLDLVARLLDRDLGQRGDGREMQVLGGFAGGGRRAVEHEHRADGLVARRDRDLAGKPARRVRQAVLHEIGHIAAQLRQALGRRLARRGHHRLAEARDDDRHRPADGVGGELCDTFEAIAGKHGVDHPQMQPPKPLDEGGRCRGGHP